MTDFRIGHGYDIHRIHPGGKLVMGGVVVSHEISAMAHSDGDVVIHALVDAILGAIGAGDIGEHFPNTDDRWKNADSSVFLTAAVEMGTKAGWHVINADITIMAERPKLKSFKPAMIGLLSKFLGTQSVNIKAGTNEGCDAIGRGEAVAAHAVVLLAQAQ